MERLQPTFVRPPAANDYVTDVESVQGIDEEFAAAVGRALGGSASVVHVSGARGSGRSWHLEALAQRAINGGMRVLRTAGHPSDRTLALGGLSALLRPVRDQFPTRQRVLLDPIVALDDGPFDPTAVRTAVFRALTALAVSRPVAIVVDDVDDIDPDSIEALSLFVRRLDADAVLVATAGCSPPPWTVSADRLTAVKLAAMPHDQLVRLLVERGVNVSSADSAASSAAGNPGLAVALADAMSDDQRAGRSAVALLPRPAGALADELHRQLRGHGDRVTRALVVAACDPNGDTMCIRAALELLGEESSCLDEAEAAGVIDIAGPRVSFRDPWMALIAPHLVAPASRRAAHRALAVQYSRPDDGAVRAWHLAAAADGTNDEAADALALVAAGAAARGASRSAILSCERAAGLANDPDRRIEHQLSALGWALDAADVGAVRRAAESLDLVAAAGDDVRLALGEARAFVDGPEAATSAWGAAPSPPTIGVEASTERSERWRARHRRRIDLVDALRRGDHVVALSIIGDAPGDPLGEGLGSALALRHRGDLRESRAHLTSSPLAPLPADGARRDLPVWGQLVATLLSADLDVLQGRSTDAVEVLDAGRWTGSLGIVAARLRARAALQLDVAARPDDQPDAFLHDDDGPLGDVRTAIGTGVLGGSSDELLRAIELGERHRLPIEVAEARMWLATRPAATTSDRQLAAGALHRCGLRGWGRRLERLTAELAAIDSVRSIDNAVEALSKAERRVADAVASGMTNREAAASLIVSVKTVDFHLQQIYRKLAIRSRTELAVRMMNATNHETIAVHASGSLAPRTVAAGRRDD